MNEVICGGVCLWGPRTVWVRRPWWQTWHQAETAEAHGPQQRACLPDRTAVGWTQRAGREHLEVRFRTQTPSHRASCVRTCGILTHRGDSVNMERLMPLKEFLTFSEGRGVHGSMWRSTRFGQSRSRSGETAGHNLYWGFPGKGKV